MLHLIKKTAKYLLCDPGQVPVQIVKAGTGPHRIDWLDTLKAIGLFFVILGHTDGISDGLRTYIYSFHIPLFFFIAGYLVDPETLRGDFSVFCHKYLRSLVLPYCCFGMVTYLVWLFAGRFYGRDLILAVPPLKPLVGMLYGVGVDHWLRHNVALWFFPSLFCLHLIYFWLHRLNNDLGMIYTVVAVSLVGCEAKQILPFRLPWSIEPACAGMIFYGAGRLARCLQVGHQQIKGLWRSLILAGCLIVQYAGILANARVDMNELMFGNFAAFYLTALSGIIFWSVVSMAMPATLTTTAIAREAMVIFPLHTLAFSAITLVTIEWLPLGFHQGSSLMAGIYTTATFAILIPAAPFIRKAIPWLKP